MKCTCGNPKMGFDCSCEHEKKYPGDINYACEFCGIYTASEPKCNKCEPDYDIEDFGEFDSLDNSFQTELDSRIDDYKHPDWCGCELCGGAG